MSSRSLPIEVAVARSVPRDAPVVAIPVATSGPVLRSLGTSRDALRSLGFTGKVGETLVLAGDGTRVRLAVGVGDHDTVTSASLRRSAAAMARAGARFESLATTLPEVLADQEAAAQAVAEGALLATYQYLARRTTPKPHALRTVVLAGRDPGALARGAERGVAVAGAVRLARDLANTPPAHLTATHFAEVALDVATEVGLEAEVWDLDAIRAEHLGGLLGVNQGSIEPPRVVRLRYRPRRASRRRGTVGLVGKGVTYDSGGISIKPTDAMHVAMKMDMTGAAVVLGAMSVLPAIDAPTPAVGWMLLTDNMPSGSAMKLGDVLELRNGRTVEIHNTDAEGRLLLADGLCLAVEEGVDAIVDVATLTGACMRALGSKIAGLLANDDAWAAEVAAASARADEPTWRLPLPPEYRSMLDSDVADLRNTANSPMGGALVAGLFLQEFVGSTPWAHLDIAGPMKADADDGWLTKGATAFGVRTLVELLRSGRVPARPAAP